MANGGQALAVVDLTAGALVTTARLARRAASLSARWAPPLLVDAGRAGASLVSQLVGDVPDRLRAQGAATRTTLEERLLALIRPVLDLVLDQIDLTELVERRVDLDRVAADLDVDAVADRLDIERVLDRLDLTEIVLRRVDLDRVADGLDIERILDRVDLIGLAEYIVDGIDLPRIIRESTGSVASESLRGVRARSIEADQALAQFVDRFFPRRRSAAAARAVRGTGPGAEAGASPDGGENAAANGAGGAPDTPVGDVDAD
ncbi:MAG: hypothetical protein ACXV3A_11790 [Kineosporiaceae bacterium]